MSLNGQEYSESYFKLHKDTDPSNFNYRLSYGYWFLVDSLMQNYSLLDVGCGTGGFYRLLSHHKSILGIDIMPEMIQQAHSLNEISKVANSSFQCVDFKNLEVSQKFDIISLSGVYGWYVSWLKSEWALQKAVSLLKNGGLLVVSHVSPTTVFEYLKYLFLRSKTIVIPEDRIVIMAKRSNLKLVLSLKNDGSPSRYLIFKKD